MAKFVLLALAVSALVVLAAAAPAPLLAADSKTAIPGSYIVIFKSGLAKSAIDTHVRRVRGINVDIVERMRFQINDFAGYSAKMSNSSLEFVRNQPEVAFVEVDQVAHIAQACATQEPTPSWGLDRINERALNLDGTYVYEVTGGEGVTSYIIDTGVYVDHVDFEGRATWGINYVDTNDVDCNGHGTHVAGTVAGASYGVAKKTTIIGVKVLNCGGSGSWAGVISGISWTANDHTTKNNKATANMSLGGGLSQAVNDAVTAAINAGVTFAIAAGNSDADACLFSPASTPTAITVGSTDTAGVDISQEDIRSSFSNFGACTHVFAPGSDITSAWIGSTTAIRTISGTSMASPHVCGVASLILADNPTFTPAQVKAALVGDASSNQIDMQCGTDANCQKSPNLMAYASC